MAYTFSDKWLINTSSNDEICLYTLKNTSVTSIVLNSQSKPYKYISL